VYGSTTTANLIVAGGALILIIAVAGTVLAVNTTGIAGAGGLASAATTVWMTGPAIQSHTGSLSVPYTLGCLVVGGIACLLLPYQAARALPGANPPRQFTPNKPLDGVLQDCFIVLVLSISAAWVPNFLFAHVSGTGNLIALGPLVPLIFLIVPGSFGGLDDEGFGQLFKVPG
jgi:hypothetical protein